MSEDQIKFNLGVLRNEFVKFMELLSKIPGSMVQKQQAFLRFDEGHMWMQNSIITYVPPPAPPEVPAPEQTVEPQASANVEEIEPVNLQSPAE